MRVTSCWTIRQAKARKCNPATFSGKRSQSRSKRRKRLVQAKERSTTQRRGSRTKPRRWVIERDFGWLSRFRRVARDQERLAEVLKGFHLIAFIMLMWKHVLPVLSVL